MKVKDLIEVLSKLDPEHEVVMSKDAEGNSYSPLSGFTKGRYEPENTWSGDFVTNDFEFNAICVWPVN